METELEPVVRPPVKPERKRVIEVPLSSWVVKSVAAALTTLMIAGGATLLGVNETNAIQDGKINDLQKTSIKIEEIDRTIHQIDTNVKVLDQKVNDLKDSMKKSK